MNTALSSACNDYVTKAIKSTMDAQEPLLDEPGILSDQLQDRLDDLSKELDLVTVFQIIVSAYAWDDSYAPLTTEPKDMLRELAYACMIAEAKQHINDMLS